MPWAPDYVTDEDLREYVRVGDFDDDAQAALAITAASRAIDDHCNRQFGQVDAVAERRYTAWPDYERRQWVVDIDDLATVTDLVVEVDGTTVTAAGYRLGPANAVADGKVWTSLAFTSSAEATPCGDVDEVAITALWGWAAVPDAVAQATLLQTSRIHKRREAPFGVAGSPTIGSEMRLLAKVDPDVAVSLRGYRRMRAVG